MREGDVALTLYLPERMREDVRVRAKSNGSTSAQFIRDAIAEKLKRARDEEQAEKDRLRKEKEEKAAATKRRREYGLGGERLAPVALDADEETSPVSDVDDAQPIYEAHAKRILEVIDHPLEKRLQILEAVKDIKRRFPLSHPGEMLIRDRLTKIVVQMHAAAPEKTPTVTVVQPAEDPIERVVRRVADAFTGQKIDPNKVESYGDVDDVSDE